MDTGCLPGTPEKENSDCDVVAAAAAEPVPLRARALPKRGALCVPGPRVRLARALRRVRPNDQLVRFPPGGRSGRQPRKEHVTLGCHNFGFESTFCHFCVI